MRASMRGVGVSAKVTPIAHAGAEARKAQLDRIIATNIAKDLTTQDLVLTSMREAILTAALLPGTRLRQEKLAKLFGTSRIPMREALRALEYEGLVRSMPRRGFTVTELDADDIEDVYDVWILLESHAVRLAVPLITDEDLEALEELYGVMVAASSGDEQLAARERVYGRLYAITGRPRLVGLISRLRQEIARSLRWPTLQHAPEHHERFFEAIRAGDADGAAAQLASHSRRYLRDASASERATTATADTLTQRSARRQPAR